ncbi:hypothetical protein CTI12_AA135260 [Artemisia annua]|uniref:Uncharacterized protein n=1 Tax=Artemisia annua TaxID=35608 RepID=A0A2U1PMJ7_ARTAN|nr:hypothetical protein CTI12_AA135260 [Artemisia annua]
MWSLISVNFYATIFASIAYVVVIFPLIINPVFEVGMVSCIIVAYVAATILGVFLLAVTLPFCLESCRLKGTMLLSKLKSEYRDAKSSLRWELLEKISLDLKGLEFHSNTDDLRGNIIDAIRLEMENDVKVGNQLLNMWEQVKKEVDSRNMLITELNSMHQSLVRDKAIEFLSTQCGKDTMHGETIVTEADKVLKNILEKTKFVEVLSQM